MTEKTLAEKMEYFARGFTLDEWAKLCDNKEFLKGFEEDPDSVKVLAEEILAK